MRSMIKATDSLTMCPPDLSITKTNAGGNTSLVGQQVTYTVRVSNSAEAGAVLDKQPITVIDIAPIGLSNLNANGGSDWTITTSTSTVATIITATYQGSYPVNAGATLADITISGTLTRDAVPTLVNSAMVSTPHDDNAENDTAIDTIAVLLKPDLAVTLEHRGSGCFKPGDIATYTITVKNAADTGSVLPGDFITVTNYIPGGLESVVMHGETDWDITQDGIKLIATYKGHFPVPAGARLQPITMTGIITASPGDRVYNALRVDTPHEGNPDDNVSGDTVYLCELSVSTPHPAQAPQTLNKSTKDACEISISY